MCQWKNGNVKTISNVLWAFVRTLNVLNAVIKPPALMVGTATNLILVLKVVRGQKIVLVINLFVLESLAIVWNAQGNLTVPKVMIVRIMNVFGQVAKATTHCAL